MADLTIKKTRPIWYNLSPANLPVPGLVSILHRVSGLLLALALVWLLYLLELSLSSEAGYRHFIDYVSHPLAKLGILVLLWSFFHHFCAGIRYLLLDLRIGIDLAGARRSSVVVFVVSIGLTVIVGAKLW